MSSSEALPDLIGESAASPIILSTTPVSAAAAATIAATTTTPAAPESLANHATSRLSPSAAMPAPPPPPSSSPSLSVVVSQPPGSPTPMSEMAPSPLLLLSTSYLPSSTTSLPSQLEKQQQAQYLRAPPPPSLRVPSPTPSSIGSVAVSATTAAVTATTTATAAGPQSVRHIGTALWNDASARRMRVNVLNELSTGWVHLSISSRVLILYYTLATLIEITVTTTILVMERAHLRTCMYLVVFLVLYLVRAVTINFFLLRKFLWTRPDNLPVNFTGAVGAHYRTMINWASLVLVLFSIAVLVTQSECSRVSPPLFYLVLTFSLLGYMCASALLLIWIGILFCMHGFMVLLELFHVGPTAMRWQGAQDDLISKVPLVRFKKGEATPPPPPPPPPSPPPPLPPMMTGGAAAATETGKKEKDIALATGVATKTLPSSTSSSSSPSSPTSSRLESHGPASTFTVTITSPDSEDSSSNSSSSRRHSAEIGRSSPPLDTIQESKQELVEETGATALSSSPSLSSSALATHEAVAAASVAMDQQEQQQEQRQEPQQQQQKRKSEIVIKIPSVPASSAEAETDTDAGEARPHFGFFAEGYQPDTPSPTTTTTVIQLPEAPPPPCATAQQQQQQQQRPLEPMATMTIEEGQGIFVDGELVQEGGPEMISNRCSICLCEYEDAEELRHMPCNHFFHRECLDEWLKLKRTCPLCKYDIQDLNRFSKRLSWKRNSHQHHHHQHRRRSSAAASTTTNNSSRNGRASLNLWRRSQS